MLAARERERKLSESDEMKDPKESTARRFRPLCVSNKCEVPTDRPQIKERRKIVYERKMFISVQS